MTIRKPSRSAPCLLAAVVAFAILSHDALSFSSSVCDDCLSQNGRRRNSPSALWSSVSPRSDDEKRTELLERARKLREEASNLEQELAPSRKKSESSAKPVTSSSVITNLQDSSWTLTYRFSSQPKDDENEKKNGMVPPNYSGKLSLLLKADGYSELVASINNDKLQIVKIWGWDEEYSQDDQNKYLLFSMDVRFPKSDPKLPGAKERYYFQARVDRHDKTGAIALGDGTITVKKDVTENSKGRWGLFQVAGILSQFRYVGDFIGRPS